MQKRNHINREIVQTADGSSILFLPDLHEHYHSIHGAIQESKHVFIHEGFIKAAKADGRLSVLEVGLGTGLNCLLTHIYANLLGMQVHYTAIEPYPLLEEEYRKINHPALLPGEGNSHIFSQIHECDAGVEVLLRPGFWLLKINQTFQEVILPPGQFNLVYFDAFGPQVQPELWGQDVFEKMATSMVTGGMLVTYSARGSVKRALKASGFTLEHPAGPPGKRQMTRATKETGDNERQ
jgi:tRNA U34 5-methylaminomethyl-2-thiouridine-forming methyltransferase MnmC